MLKIVQAWKQKIYPRIRTRTLYCRYIKKGISQTVITTELSAWRQQDSRYILGNWKWDWGSGQRLEWKTNKLHSEENNICVIKNIIDRMIETGQTFWINFIDLRVPVDSIDRSVIWKYLREKEVWKHLIKVIKSVYNKSQHM